MKKILILLMVIVAAALVFAGCTLGKVDDKKMDDNTMATDKPHATDETMEKGDDSMDAEETMEKGEENMKEEETMEENLLDVDLMDINGNKWNLSKLDQKAVVKVWASWCSICLSGMDELNEFAGEYKDAKVLTIVSPGMLGEKDKDDFISWFKSLEGVENVVVILDEEAVLIKGLGIRGFPTYVFVDSNGYVDSAAIGHQEKAAVVEKLESIG